MAESDDATRPRGSAEFVESSVLEALVPDSSVPNLKEELESWDGKVDGDSNSIVPFLSQRHFLLFGEQQSPSWSSEALLLMPRTLDELVPVYIALRTPSVDESTLKSFLARLAISLESFAFSTAPNPDSTDTSAHPQKELIFSETIKETHEPFIVRPQTDTESYIYIVWKINVFICKPSTLSKDGKC